MATVTRSSRSLSPAASSPAVSKAAASDVARPFLGDRIAFIIWITCALFMASLLAFDTVVGLFR